MTQDQFNKLDKCHFTYSLEDDCTEELINARALLGANRFDIYAILIYIDAKVRGFEDMTYAQNVYKERVCAVTGFTFSEDGNEYKNSFTDYLLTLNSLIEAFRCNTIDINSFLIPIDNNGTLIDGAHRVACAAYFGKSLNILRFNKRTVYKTDFKILSQNLLSPLVLDSLALESTKWHTDLYMLFFWPKSFRSQKKMSEALELIQKRTEVFYVKDCQMTYFAIRNLMLQIYGHMDWIGSIDNDFQSTYEKADAVWDNNGCCRFILIRAQSCQYVLQLKSELRDIFDIGLASVHSSDNIRETKIAANALFNPNSFHFLTKAKPTLFKSSFILFERFKQEILNQKFSLDNFIVDSSMILAMYGTRIAEDLDYYCVPNDYGDVINIENVERHDDEQLDYYSVSAIELIWNPSYYFVFNEVKFICLPLLQRFKQNRYNVKHDKKDLADLQIIDLLLKNNTNQNEVRKIARKARVLRMRRVFVREFKKKRNVILQQLGLYTFLKNKFGKE